MRFDCNGKSTNGMEVPMMSGFSVIDDLSACHRIQLWIQKIKMR